MATAIVDKDNYRIFNTPDKLVLECDAVIFNEILGTRDKIVKQLVLTDDMDMTVEHLTDLAILKMAEYEDSFADL